MDFTTYFWLGLLVIFLIVEAACPIHLVSVWFAAGALLAALVSVLGGLFWLQAAVFLVVSGALLICLWPFVKKVLNPKHAATNVDALLGAEGYVTADIDNLNAVGQVKLNGMEWSARSTSGEPVTRGTRIRVDRIEGVKVFVTPVKEEVTV